MGSLLESQVPERFKLVWFETLQDDVDVVFLGSSHVLHQMDPSVFDDVRNSKRTSSIAVNLGAPAMEVGEELYLVKKILSARPSHLQWLVVEALPWDVGMRRESGNDFGVRRVEWHDSAVTAFLVRLLLTESLPWDSKWPLLQRHFEHWWRRTLHLARGVDATTVLFHSPLEFYHGETRVAAEGNGYHPLEMAAVGAKGRENRKAFLADPHKLFAARQRLPQVGAGGQATPGLRASAVWIEKLAREHGVGIIWWIHPNLGRNSGWRNLLADGTIQHLIAFDDPQRYPAFYKVRWHFDLYHLTRDGSEMLTQIFAREFLRETAGSEN